MLNAQAQKPPKNNEQSLIDFLIPIFESCYQLKLVFIQDINYYKIV